MKRKNQRHIPRLAGVLLAVFLFTSLASAVVNSLQFNHQIDGVQYSSLKHSTAPSDNQLPYEEKELEKETERSAEERLGHFQFFVFSFSESLFGRLDQASFDQSFLHIRLSGNPTGFPLYLSTRSLRI